MTPIPASASHTILTAEAAIGGRADWVVSLDRRLIDLAEFEGSGSSLALCWSN